MFRFIIPVLALAFVAASCSKEKKIERQLARKDGKWNITEFSEYSSTDGETDYSNTYPEGGDITFDESTFVWNMNATETPYSFAGTWSNTENTLTFVSDGESIVYKIEESSKKEIKLSFSDSYNFDGSTVVYKQSMTLVKD